MSPAPSFSCSTGAPLRGVDIFGSRSFAFGFDVSSYAANVSESRAIPDVVEVGATALMLVDVESSQRVCGHLFRRVVCSELADEMVGSETCQPRWTGRLRRPFADEDGAGSAFPDASPNSPSAVVVEDDSLRIATPPDDDCRRPRFAGEVVNVESECFCDLQPIANEQGDECFQAWIERCRHGSTGRDGLIGETHCRTRVA
jgi:hypothetical protein